MPTRVSTGGPRVRRAPSLAPSRTRLLGGPVIAPSLRKRDAFDSTKPQADGSLVLGRRANGPGEVVLSKGGDLLLEGKKGPAAAIEVARLIETGVSPFAHASETQRAALIPQLERLAEPARAGKQSSSAVLARSAAATLLLSLVRTSEGKSKDQALRLYLGLLEREPNPKLRTSMLLNLDAAHVPLRKPQAAQVEGVRAQVQPAAPPYDTWFKGSHPKLEARQFVMDDFWREEAAANRKRGFKAVHETHDEIVWERTLHDPAGEHPDVTVHMVTKRGETNVLRDMNDPNVQMIIYSGHSQYGGVADNAVRTGPAKMAGDKLVAFFACRDQQEVAPFKNKYPAGQLLATFSSSYGSDDSLVLDRMFDVIGQRGSYQDVRSGLHARDMLQPKSNYILPDDARQLAYVDDDMDGVRDSSALGPDRFFDPSNRHATGGPNSFQASAVTEDPLKLSGRKVEHAVDYANTGFYYFSEENHASRLLHKDADRFVPGGWFVSDKSDPVRIVEKKRDGKTFFEVSVNSRYADKSRAAITAMVIYEMQAHLALKKTGKFSEDDKLRALVIVQGYLDLYEDFSDGINEVLQGFAKKYGYHGPVNYDVLWKAMKHDDEEHTATRATLDALKAAGISASA
jgi:hypothetical protein